MDEEEFKTFSEKRKQESEKRKSEMDPNSPMPYVSKSDTLDELIQKTKQNGIQSQPEESIPVNMY